MCDSDHDEGHCHGHGNSKDEFEHSDIETYHKISEIFHFLEGKGLVIKDAGYLKTRVEYARGKDLLKSIQDNISEVVERLNKINSEYKLESANKNIIIQIYQM